MEVDITSYMKMAETSTPKRFSGSSSQCEGVSYSYDFKRGDLTFSTSKKAVHYGIDGDFSLKLNYCPLCVKLWNGKPSCTVPRIYGSCGIDEPRIRYAMDYKTTLGLNKDYTLSSSTELTRFRILDPCEITFVNYDVTDRVRSEMKKELIALEKNIDDQIRSIDVKSSIQSFWNTLDSPIPLDRYGYLYLNPRSVALSQIKYNNKKAYFSLNLAMAPIVSTNRLAPKKNPLVEMADFKETNGFNITADVKASYDSLSSILTSFLYDKRIQIKGKDLILKEINIPGTQDGRLVIGVKFEGNKKGLIYLTGNPVLNKERQLLEFRQVDF